VELFPQVLEDKVPDGILCGADAVVGIALGGVVRGVVECERVEAVDNVAAAEDWPAFLESLHFFFIVIICRGMRIP